MRNKLVKYTLNVVLSAIVFFLITMPFRELFRVMSVTEMRPASALPPALGLMFGVPGALGCTIGNLIADIISGYSLTVCILGIPAQFIFGILPWLLWKLMGGKEVRLNSVKNFLRYLLIILINSLIMAVLLGGIFEIEGIDKLFSTSSLMVFLNNFVFGMVLGIPIVIMIGMYRIKKNGDKLSLNERFILIFLVLGVITAVTTGFSLYSEMSVEGYTPIQLWNRLFAYMSVDLFVFYIVTAIFLWYTEKNITIPVEKITDVAKNYVDTKNDKVDYDRVVHMCAPLCQNNSEIGYLAQAFKTMVLNIEDYIARLTTITAEKERVGVELSVATQIQSDMLPSIFPPFPERMEFDIFASMTPAKEVGGDFYDFYILENNKLAFLIADVSGKGIPAAMFMTTSKIFLKSLAETKIDVNEVFTRANKKLCENNNAGMFVTAWMGILDLETGKVTFANAGHNPPLVRHSDGKFEYLKVPANFVLAGKDNIKYRLHEIQLLPGDEIFLYTDGVTEASNLANEMYGDNRLKDTLNKLADEGVEDICRHVKSDVDAFVGKASQFDDITMLCMKYKGIEKAAVLNVEAKVDKLEEVLHFVNSELEARDCNAKDQMQINIAVEEIFVNIANYAYAPNIGDAEITISFNASTREVMIDFIDSGVPYNPLTKDDPDITLSAKERQLGGLGIYIVKESMDDVAYEYSDEKNILSIRKKI